ncbi:MULTISPECIES: hypothetical protein [Pseudomonas]|uniref:Uncharacterized protein n=1 Tax=Pseudomonas wuhanensis TaxID=2954098 RepID=A0ABY9GUK3_9PSED|nr:MULTISPECIES: hypothetical protein [unclassified Pseudomonas]WLI13441.1 hypothetical protein PSH65_04575 [Pseudomonas sp. FP603]WLI19328.1 hypothetical protein PSH88_04575 [Pseudomonas sp. FP607]
MWLLILGIPTLWLMVGVFVHFGVLDKDSPGWVQAIGSIAAIFVAVLITHRQGEQQTMERRNKDRVVSNLIVGVATRAAAVASLLFHSFNDLQLQVQETNEEILTTVESQVLALRGINPMDLPRPEMVEPFLRIRAIMEQSYVMAGLLAKGRDGYVDRLRCATVFAHNSQAARIAAEELQQAALD